LCALEREEDLDFATFGGQKTVDGKPIDPKLLKKPPPVVPATGLKADDILSLDYLQQLEANTVETKSTTTYGGGLFDDAPPAQTAADIDISSLDLNAYISQQSGQQGGGLFD